MLIMESGKREITEGIEQSKQKGNLQVFGEKETYKYLGILEADYQRRKKKFGRSTWDERGNFS